MMMMGGKRRAGRAAILAAEVHKTPLAAFQGIGVVVVALMLGVLAYEALHHRNNTLREENVQLAEENQALEQQIIRSRSTKSHLTSPNNQFLQKLEGLQLQRVSSARKRIVPRKDLMAWYQRAVWDASEEELEGIGRLPRIAGRGIPSIDPVDMAMGEEPIGLVETGMWD